MASKRTRTAPEAPAGSTSGGRSGCPIAHALDLLGDRWTLLIIRDLIFTDKRRYNDLAESPEGVPTNILADRLRKLEACGVVERHPYQEKPTRYEYRPTAKGKDLREVLISLMGWAARHVPGVSAPPPEVLARLNDD